MAFRTTNKTLVILALILISFSCHLPSAGTKENDTKRILKLQLKTLPGSIYQFNINSQSELTIETDDKSIHQINKSMVSLKYEIGKDTSGNISLRISFDKIHLFSKAGDSETEIDASDPNSFNPMEKAFSLLRSANITAILNPSGEVKSIEGVNFVCDQILSMTEYADQETKSKIRSELDSILDKQLIRNNLQQIFRIFPDSAIRIGDRWTILPGHNEQNLNSRVVFQLTGIQDGIASIHAEGSLESDSSYSKFMGPSVMARLKGKIESVYNIELHTGMLLDGRISSGMEGTMDMMDKKVPVKMKNEVKISGIRIK